MEPLPINDFGRVAFAIAYLHDPPPRSAPTTYFFFLKSCRARRGFGVSPETPGFLAGFFRASAALPLAVVKTFRFAIPMPTLFTGFARGAWAGLLLPEHLPGAAFGELAAAARLGLTRNARRLRARGLLPEHMPGAALGEAAATTLNDFRLTHVSFSTLNKAPLQFY